MDISRRRPVARCALGLRGDRLGRLLRVGSCRERSVDAVARSHRLSAFGDDPGEARNVARLEHGARRTRVLSFDLRHVPDAIRSHPVDPLVCGKPARRVVPRVHLHRGRRLDRIDHPALAAAAREDEARVARLPRGDVPLQQSAARRTLPHDSLGRDLSDRVAARSRRDVDCQQAVLQLLPAQLRPAASAADGDRAARRVAAGVAPRTRASA